MNDYLPVCEITIWPLDVVPDGWLECDGSAISRITYNYLYSNIGETFGIGDGYTTFNVPDLRGLFVRAQNSMALIDPDALSRTDRGDGITGDFVGTIQDSQSRGHLHRCYLVAPIPFSGFTFGGTWSLGTINTYYRGSTEMQPNNMSLKFIIRYEKVQDGR
jgi:microcystin-dependent protein